MGKVIETLANHVVVIHLRFDWGNWTCSQLRGLHEIQF